MRSAGTYAEERFRKGLSSWRRRSVPAVAWRFAVLDLGALGLLAWPGGTLGAFAAGGVVGASIVAFLAVWDEPPYAVLNWQRGALGERLTEEALEPLLRNGWRALHDIQLRRGNIDHLIHGPPGTFLLETKYPRGRVSIERGLFVTRPIDDPEKVSRVDLREQLQRRCADVKGGRVPGVKRTRRVQPVVVVWGHFDARIVASNGIVYIRGADLADWLRSRLIGPLQPLSTKKT